MKYLNLQGLVAMIIILCIWLKLKKLFSNFNRHKEESEVKNMNFYNFIIVLCFYFWFKPLKLNLLFFDFYICYPGGASKFIIIVLFFSYLMLSASSTNNQYD